MYQSTRRYTTEEGRIIAKKIFIYCRYDYTVAQLVTLQLPRWLHHTSHTTHTAHTAHHTHTHTAHRTLNITFHLYFFKWTPQPRMFQQKLYSYWACTFVWHTHSGGKVKILRGYMYRPHWQKSFVWTCVKFWMVTETELLESTLHQALWMAMKKDKSLTVNSILILTLICLTL